MRKKKLMATLFSGLAIMFANSFTVKAETSIPIVAPPPYEEPAGPGVNIKNNYTRTSPAGTGEQVAAYARQFIGNPYAYGGTSLTEGADCSGFVMSVYQQFGINLPRTSEEQGKAGTDAGGLEYAQPGDLISYIGHIGIYAGQNQVIHASGPEDGIKVSKVDFMPILSVRRILN
ncbi:C40 family peptidase [Clostridium sp. Marseille-P2415]|uniref:C40 family peptidase n=1 Tax=Clostridium sp. Marseille-P2415 TaxID=1805471 RepID=UPI0009887B06|nr:C40 family peptidase [Clostridium sp. Marseille-P2415]